MENLVIVAHLDDEIIWFSSILEKPNTALVICFSNEEGLDYSSRISKVLEEYKKTLPVIWLRIPKNTTPRIFGKVDKNVLSIFPVKNRGL